MKLGVKVAILNGASGGIGSAVARKFAREGAICPGRIVTEVVAGVDPQVERMVLEETPLKRYGNPGVVANAALYLASGDSDFVTRNLHLVSGGRGMH